MLAGPPCPEELGPVLREMAKKLCAQSQLLGYRGGHILSNIKNIKTERGSLENQENSPQVAVFSEQCAWINRIWAFWNACSICDENSQLDFSQH